MNVPDIKVDHFSSKGEKFTQEVYSNGAGCIEIIKDMWGNQLDMSGSGGYRPWMK